MHVKSIRLNIAKNVESSYVLGRCIDGCQWHSTEMHSYDTAVLFQKTLRGFRQYRSCSRKRYPLFLEITEGAKLQNSNLFKKTLCGPLKLDVQKSTKCKAINASDLGYEVWDQNAVSELMLCDPAGNFPLKKNSDIEAESGSLPNRCSFFEERIAAFESADIPFFVYAKPESAMKPNILLRGQRGNEK